MLCADLRGAPASLESPLTQPISNPPGTPSPESARLAPRCLDPTTRPKTPVSAASISSRCRRASETAASERLQAISERLARAEANN